MPVLYIGISPTLTPAIRRRSWWLPPRLSRGRWSAVTRPPLRRGGCYMDAGWCTRVAL